MQALVREQLPRLRTEADRAALLANLICEAFGNYMGVVTEESALPPLAQLQVLPAWPSLACGCVHPISHASSRFRRPPSLWIAFSPAGLASPGGLIAT